METPPICSNCNERPCLKSYNPLPYAQWKRKCRICSGAYQRSLAKDRLEKPPTVIIPRDQRPFCKDCGKNRVAMKYYAAKMRTVCHSCMKKRANNPMGGFRGNYGSGYRRRQRLRRPFTEAHAPCSQCGFEYAHQSQMDLDHIDGNHKNNEPSNLQWLCANCHRLKTFLSGDSWKEAVDPLPVIVG